jgi:hypothetical protein
MAIMCCWCAACKAAISADVTPTELAPSLKDDGDPLKTELAAFSAPGIAVPFRSSPPLSAPSLFAVGEVALCPAGVSTKPEGKPRWKWLLKVSIVAGALGGGAGMPL